ncbi:RAxF-45 family protein [Paenibacillus marinisediminis]
MNTNISSWLRSLNLDALRTQLRGIFHDGLVNGIRMSIFSNSIPHSHSSEMTILSLP